MTKQVAKQDKISEFIKKDDTALWVRSMSEPQCKACFALMSAIRDDGEQGTTYRVRSCLDGIGITPIIKSKYLHEIIQLSRGSDLAFLYFLLEGHYRSKQRNSYTPNEQLLMSAITELDLQFTIRELDKILPNGHLSKREELKLSRRKSYKSSIHMLNTYYPRINELDKPKKRKPKSFPYFQKLVRPKRIILHKKCHKPEYKVSFPFWKVGSDPVYSINNESRWFANYVLHPSVRIVKHLVSNLIEKLLGTDPCCSNEIDIQKMDGNKDILCEYHRFWLKEYNLNKANLLVKAKERCVALIDVDARTHKERRETIIAQLDHDVGWFIDRRKELEGLQLTYVQTLSEPQCKICTDLITTMTQKNNIKVISLDNDIGTVAKANTDDVKTISQKIPTTDHCADIDMRSSGGDDDNITLKKKVSKNVKCLPRVNISNVYCKKSKICLVDVGANSEKTRRRRSSYSHEVKQKYFYACTESAPYKFEYKRVFPPTLEKNYIDISTIRRYFIKALKRKDSFKSIVNTNVHVDDECLVKLNKNLSSELSSSVSETFEYDRTNLVNGIVQCAESIWSKRLEETKPQIDAKYGKRIDELRKSLETVLPQGQRGHMKDGRLKYDIQYFDPNNDTLMDQLLKDGMNELSKDNRFVLASFEDAHKLPILRQWVRRRYGKSYTHKELVKSFGESFMVFHYVMALQNEVPIVKLCGMPTEPIPLTRLKAMRKLGTIIKKEYTQILNDNLMQHATYCWFAMGGYLVPSGPPKNIFYSYMPARNKDIQRVSPWNGKYRDYKLFRDICNKENREPTF